MTAKKKSPKRATKKPVKKATKVSPPLEGLSFSEDIPAITRASGGRRRSKYDDLLDEIKKHANDEGQRVGVLQLATQAQATGRYVAIKAAVERRRETLGEPENAWTLTTRNLGEEEGFRVYIRWNL